jgi:peptidoglycan hydrolase-like protein with peptidoglycan-binding domain
MLQALLNFLHQAGVTIDGDYGDETRSAVQKHLGRYCWTGNCEVDDVTINQLAQLANKNKDKWFSYLKNNKGFQAVKAQYSLEKTPYKKV